MRARGSSPYAIPVLLASRVLVGVCTGVGHMPSKRATLRQCVGLLAVFALLFAWLCHERPFLVPAATACEMAVVALQFATVLLNFAFVGEDAAGTFLGLSRADALKTQKHLITATVVFMGLRFVAVMLPARQEILQST